MRAERASREKRRQMVERALRYYERLLHRSKSLPWPVWDLHREEVFLQQRIQIESMEHAHWLLKKYATKSRWYARRVGGSV